MEGTPLGFVVVIVCGLCVSFFFGGELAPGASALSFHLLGAKAVADHEKLDGPDYDSAEVGAASDTGAHIDGWRL